MLRPSAVYGFGMRHPIFIKPMVENAVRGRATTFANGREFPRDYTHVGDVAQMTLRALDVPADRVRDRIFYAATGQPLRTAGELAEILNAWSRRGNLDRTRPFRDGQAGDPLPRGAEHPECAGAVRIRAAVRGAGRRRRGLRREYRRYLESTKGNRRMSPRPPSDTLGKYFSLAGRAALVTGASGGIGRRWRWDSPAAGAAVALHGRSERQLEETAAAVARPAARASSSRPTSTTPACATTSSGRRPESLGRLDVLVNCAGMNRRKPIEAGHRRRLRHDHEREPPVARTCSAGRLARSCVRHGGGKIVHVASLTTFIGLGGTSVYGMTKAALRNSPRRRRSSGRRTTSK